MKKTSHSSKGPKTNSEVFKMPPNKNLQQKNVRKLNPSSTGSGFHKNNQKDLENLDPSLTFFQNTKSNVSLSNDQNNNPNFSELKNEDLSYSNSAFSLTFTQNQNNKALFGYPTEFNNNENAPQNFESLISLSETGNFGSTPQKEKPEASDLDQIEKSGKKLFSELRQSKEYNLSAEKLKISEKAKMDEMLNRLQKDHEQNKLALLQFRLDKLSFKLDKVLLQANLRQKLFSFSLIKEFSKEEKLKWLKVSSD